MSDQDALRMQGASLDFGGGAGVFDLTLDLPKGAILGMIGPSGCGKTTTIRLLNGIYTPTAGAVRIFGKPPAKFAQQEKERLGYIPQQFILYPNLSVEENLHFLGGLYGMSRRQRQAKIPALLEFVELTAARRRLGRKLLLLSVFFTGFFLPMTGFAWPAWIIAILLPMTHALEGFRALLLEGRGVSSDLWWALLIISALAYGLVLLIMRRQYRKTSG